MIIRLKKLVGSAVVPCKAHADDFCYDVVAVSCEEVAPNVYKYGTGLSFEIVRKGWRGDELLNYAISFRPRSSVWKTGMVLSNCVGTIDEGYRGEVFAVFYHVMPDMPKYEVGDRIGQIYVSAADPVAFEEASELGETERGSGGYGSSGR